MLSYGKKESVDWKQFYKKRFRTLYPMFWVAFFIVFLYDFYKNSSIPQGIPKSAIIWSILGFDGYVSNFGIPTFYLVGEWFLGFIILIYVIFPILLYFVKKVPKWFSICMFSGLYVCTLLFYKGEIPIDIIVTTRLPEILFGMYWIQLGLKPSRRMALGSFLVLLLNSIVDFSWIHSSIRTLYIGICAFVFLVYFAERLDFSLIKRICSVICKYSYPCFIIHHIIIYRMSLKFDLSSMTFTKSTMLFMCCGVVIILASFGLYRATKMIESVAFGDSE